MTQTLGAAMFESQQVDARLVMDVHGEIREANVAAHRLLRYRPGMLVGISLARLIPPSRQALLHEVAQAFENGAPCSLPGVLACDDGSQILVVLTTEHRTGPRGRELVLVVELDDEPTSAIRRGDLEALRAAARPTPPVPSTVPAPGPEGPPAAAPEKAKFSPARPTSLSVRQRSPRIPVTRPAGRREPDASPIDVPAQLAACSELLRWLDSQLQQPATQETPQERALARILIREASQLIEICREAVAPVSALPRR